MSLQPSDPPLPVRPVSEQELAVELTDFVEREPLRSRELATARRHQVFRRRTRLSIALFLATCGTTFLAGFIPGEITGSLGVVIPVAEHFILTGELPHLPPRLVTNGLVFSGCLMSILLAHEMGHFLLALRHRVPATLPFFIPLPIGPFGTMGAVIVQDGAKADRRQLFDIAIAGPIAGLVVAIPVLWYGVRTSSVEAFAPGHGGYGNPLLLEWIVARVHHPIGPGEDILLNAPLFAGWVGIFITALNLLPVGQLDGGHILYTLIGRKAHYVAYAVLAAAIGWMIYSRMPNYILIVLLLFLFGPKHPQTANDRAPLGITRVLLGSLVLAFLAIGFTPTPILG